MIGWQDEAAAKVWLQTAERRNQMMAKATARMFERAGVAEGLSVLDVGTGTGDTALMLAAKVGPKGREVAIETVRLERRFASAAEAAKAFREMPMQMAVLAAAPDREAALAEIERGYEKYERAGECAMPAALLVATGTA